MIGVWWSADRLKPIYGRRRVRKLCDHIDLLKRLLDRANDHAMQCDRLMHDSEEKHAALFYAARELVDACHGISAQTAWVPVQSVQALRSAIEPPNPDAPAEDAQTSSRGRSDA